MLTDSESTARGALEAVASHAFTDLEWERSRVRLVEFVTILLASQQPSNMSEVYRARDPRLNRDVDIKVSAALFSERFERSALG